MQSNSFFFFSFQVVGAEAAAMSSKGLNRVCKRFMLRPAGFALFFFGGGVFFFFFCFLSLLGGGVYFPKGFSLLIDACCCSLVITLAVMLALSSTIGDEGRIGF